MGSGSSQVDVVETGTGTHHDLQLLGSVEDLGIGLVRTNDHGIDILHGVEQLSFLSVFLEQHQLVACTFNFLTYALDSCCCKGLLCCY